MLRQLYSCLLSAVPQSACLSVYQEIAVSSQPPAPPYHSHVVAHPSLILSECGVCAEAAGFKAFPCVIPAV